jgi:hypothetical protein
MNLTALQPLLILAALAVVGGMPLLSAIGPGACAVSRAESAERSHVAVAERRAARSVRNDPAPSAAQCAPRAAGAPSAEGVRLAQRSWTVRRGTVALPPPRA